jgi:hypothetical protein
MKLKARELLEHIAVISIFIIPFTILSIAVNSGTGRGSYLIAFYELFILLWVFSFMEDMMKKIDFKNKMKKLLEKRKK